MRETFSIFATARKDKPWLYNLTASALTSGAYPCGVSRVNWKLHFLHLNRCFSWIFPFLTTSVALHFGQIGVFCIVSEDAKYTPSHYRFDTLEFFNDREGLLYESECLIEKLRNNSHNLTDDASIIEDSIILGQDVEALVKKRVNQFLFRKMVLSNYNFEGFKQVMMERGSLR